MTKYSGLIAITCNGFTAVKIHLPEGGERMSSLVLALASKFNTEESLSELHTKVMGDIDLGKPIPYLADMYIDACLPPVHNVIFQFRTAGSSVLNTLGRYDSIIHLGYELEPSSEDYKFKKSFLSPIFTNLEDNGMAHYTNEIRLTDNNPTIVIEHKSEIIY